MQPWSILELRLTNYHFIPYTEEEVSANDRFESDFMVKYMQDNIFSMEAQNVLEEGKNW